MNKSFALSTTPRHIPKCYTTFARVQLLLGGVMIWGTIGFEVFCAVLFYLSLRSFRRSKAKGDKVEREKARSAMALSVAIFIDGLIVAFVPRTFISSDKLTVTLLIVPLLAGIVTLYIRRGTDD